MGGDASPFIAYLYHCWCEYCFMVYLGKSNTDLARDISENNKYLDDIVVVIYLGFGDVTKVQYLYHQLPVGNKHQIPYYILWVLFSVFRYI